MTRHVVFGTGQVGRLVAEQLVALGHDVVTVNRSGRSDIPGAHTIAGDATNPSFTTRVTTGADVVYFCLNAPHYNRWAQEFPPLQHAVLTGAEKASARLVVLDNLYTYGPTHGRSLVETLPPQPTSAKSATRAAMTVELLHAHSSGRVEVAIGRASDFFGPRTTNSALGETVFGTALTGRRAQVMGNPDLLHSYSYTPDVAAALITLGTQAGATGSIWHLPVDTARSTRQIVETTYRLAGQRPRILAAGRTTLTLLGATKPAIREYLNTLYQITNAWVVDDSKFRSTFNVPATGMDEALATTLRWYQHAAQRPAPTQVVH